MPFFTGAYNFQIHGANMIDNAGGTYIGGNYVGGHQVGGNYNAGNNNVGGDVNTASSPNASANRNTASDHNPALDHTPPGNNPPGNNPAAGTNMIDNAGGTHIGGSYVGGHQVRGNYNTGNNNVGGNSTVVENQNQVLHQRPPFNDMRSSGTVVNSHSHSPDVEKGQFPEDKEIEPPTGLTSFFYNLYTLFLLRIPNIYLARIERLGGQAELAQEDIFAMAATTNWPRALLGRGSGKSRNGKVFLEYVSELERDIRRDGDLSTLPISYLSLGNKWKDFVKHLLREWQTLNIVSALLIPGILPIFNIAGANNNPVTRYLAFWSLISALLSLLYGCLFIIQFSQMKKTIVGIELLQHAFREDNIAFWAVDIMLALPAIWLAWSILAYITCIMTFLWRAGPVPPIAFDTPNSMVLGFRVFISIVLGIGVTYTLVIFYTFKRYGRSLDASFARQLEDIINAARKDPPPQ